jgi:nucleoside-diphosphate-sugar epimerase
VTGGGAGLIGRHLVEKLMESQVENKVFVNLSSGGYINMSFIKIYRKWSY